MISDSEIHSATFFFDAADKIRSGAAAFEVGTSYWLAATQLAGEAAARDLTLSEYGPYLMLRHPVAQNFGLAVEIFLKSFLLARGLTEKSLRSAPYGHNLENLLAEGQRHDLVVSEFAASAISALNGHYAAHEHRYPAPGEMLHVSPHALTRTVSELREAGAAAVLSAASAIGTDPKTYFGLARRS